MQLVGQLVGGQMSVVTVTELGRLVHTTARSAPPHTPTLQSSNPTIHTASQPGSQMHALLFHRLYRGQPGGSTVCSCVLLVLLILQQV